MPNYVPSLPHGTPNPGATDGPSETGSAPWEPAPATSHVHSWQWFDVREYPFLRRFPGAIGKGRSELYVRFKDKRGGPTPAYRYYFDSAAAGETIVRRLRGSGHPYAEVLLPLVIRGGVPYTRA